MSIYIYLHIHIYPCTSMHIWQNPNEKICPKSHQKIWSSGYQTSDHQDPRLKFISLFLIHIHIHIHIHILLPHPLCHLFPITYLWCGVVIGLTRLFFLLRCVSVYSIFRRCVESMLVSAPARECIYSINRPSSGLQQWGKKTISWTSCHFIYHTNRI